MGLVPSSPSLRTWRRRASRSTDAVRRWRARRYSRKPSRGYAVWCRPRPITSGGTTRGQDPVRHLPPGRRAGRAWRHVGGVAVGWRDAPHFRHADHGRQPLSLIQERMPVIIERADWQIWLGEGDGDVTALLSPLSPDRLRIWPVARTVNSVKNDGPELLEPHSVDIDEPVLV
jgi:SOS response associated peptidase (SRAP)